jgi:hypothetical protein
MTEAEAKTKWCPYTFGVSEIRNGNGDGIRESGPWTCRGAECMAWRSLEKTEPIVMTHGYCGLAGQP